MSDLYVPIEQGDSDSHDVARKHTVHRFMVDTQGQDLIDVDLVYDVENCKLTLSILPSNGKGIDATAFVRPEHLSTLVAGLAASADVLNEIRKMEGH